MSPWWKTGCPCRHDNAVEEGEEEEEEEEEEGEEMDKEEEEEEAEALLTGSSAG